MARRKKKNNTAGIAVFVSVLIVLLITFYPYFLQNPTKLFFLTILFILVIFVAYKIVKHKRTLAIPVDPFQIKPSDSQHFIDMAKVNLSTLKNIDEPQKLEQWSLQLLQKMDWKHFEEVCCSYFESLGYDAKMSQMGADEGIDVYLHKDNYPNKIFGIVQCKRWTKQVGVEQIRAFFGVQADKQAPLAIFIATAGFSKAAISFCENKHLKLISGTELLHQIQQLPHETQLKILEQATRGDYTTPTCANCDIKMVERKSKKSNQQFWGCPHYPRCKSTLYLKK